MKPAAFAYARAGSVPHALDLLGSDVEGAKILAGGQSLMPALNMRLSAPRLLVDINHLGELKNIVRSNGHLDVGALVRQTQAEQCPDIERLAPLLALALPHIAHPAIRNRGTIGGSIAYADPAAELPACLVALGGEVEIAGPRGRRTVAAEQFFTGLFETAIAPGEMLTAIRVPVADDSHRCGFAELARRHGDYAIVGLAATARAEGGRLRDVRLVYFGIGATPVRARGAEAALADATLTDAITALAGDLDPEGDVHTSAAGKKHLAGVLLRRVARQLAEGAA